MKKLIMSILLIVVLFSELIGQTERLPIHKHDLIGVWRYDGVEIDGLSGNEASLRRFDLYNGEKHLEIYITINDYLASQGSNLFETLYGFTNLDPDQYEIDVLDEEGLFFVEKSLDKQNLTISGSKYWQTDKNQQYWTYGGSDVFIWNKIQDIPFEIYQFLQIKGQENNRNYIQEYLYKDVKSICVSQLDVFDNINGNNVGYLISGDLVEILEEQPDWVKIKYLKTDAEYWIYDSCLE